MVQLTFTAFLNRLFGPQVLALLEALHIHPKYPKTPISNSFSMELLVVLLLTIFFIAVRARLSVERPGALQHTMEGIHGFVVNMADEVIGHHSSKYVPYLVTLGMFILSCNLIGLIPGINSPTELETVTLALAIATFVYYNFYGFKEQGIGGYLKHFAGPVWWLAWLMFPIEIVSHLDRKSVV